MSLPEPYSSADDATLLEGCVHGDEEAWAALTARHGSLVYATVARALDGPRAGEIDLDAAVGLVWHRLREAGSPLHSWRGECQLRSYLTVIARHVALSDAAASAPAAFVPSLPTPSGLFLDDLMAAEPAARVEHSLDRLPPNIGALVRLRLRGLSRDDVAATLGVSPASVRSNLERVAQRLGDLDGGDVASPWRVLLDAAEIEERVAEATRTEDDPAFRAARALVEKTWRLVRERALARAVSPTAACLDARSTAAFVDGSLRGAARGRAEGHIGSCVRCIDEAAGLVLDLRAASVLREAGDLHAAIAAAAACAATSRFAAAERLCERPPAGIDARTASDIRRLAQTGRLLEGGRPARPEQTSQVVAAHLPSDDEAPLVAIEALALGDIHTAARAIDDHMARQSLGGRLRLLAAASGHDLEGARWLAEATLRATSVDPGHTRDARATVALAPGRALPREILVERLRALLPEAVRFVLTRPGH